MLQPVILTDHLHPPVEFAVNFSRYGRQVGFDEVDSVADNPGCLHALARIWIFEAGDAVDFITARRQRHRDWLAYLAGATGNHNSSIFHRSHAGFLFWFASWWFASWLGAKDFTPRLILVVARFARQLQ